MGATLPRVTEILEAVGLGPDFSMVKPVTLELARQRGSGVHAAIEAHAYGYFEDSMLTEETAPYFAAYRRFLEESGHTAIATEIEVMHEAWQYIGHPDRVGWLVGRRAILDWKSTDVLQRKPAARQLAAYRLAWNHMHPAELVDVLVIVQFRRDGSFRLHEIDREESARGEEEFLAARIVYRAQQEAIAA